MGGEFNADSHGIADLGLRNGPWSVQLFTETLRARFEPSWAKGRAWVGTTGRGGAGQMLISPWVDGEPRPDLALLARSVGLDAGAQRYGPGGTWLGASAQVDRWWFAPRSEATDRLIPTPRTVVTADLHLGWWRPASEVRFRLGADQGPALAPHAHLRAELRPQPTWSPWVLLHAGVAEGQDELLRTRVGGLNPYVIPLAGASWAEWWVEDYAALRAGLRWSPGDWQATLLTDGFLSESDWALGTAAALRWSGPVVVEGAVGYSPTVERRRPTGGLAVFLMIERPFPPQSS